MIAGLAGISTATLSRIEAETRALDSLTLIVTLANALELTPSELTKLLPAGTRIPPPQLQPKPAPHEV